MIKTSIEESKDEINFPCLLENKDGDILYATLYKDGSYHGICVNHSINIYNLSITGGFKEEYWKPIKGKVILSNML